VCSLATTRFVIEDEAASLWKGKEN
jgi:hypothetical protein